MYFLHKWDDAKNITTSKNSLELIVDFCIQACQCHFSTRFIVGMNAVYSVVTPRSIVVKRSMMNALGIR